tara:strand:+ start:8129 stop:8269 length:141 start_codon:yes stop_codon:yes gene_type:complete
MADKSIEIPITEEDIRLFQELIKDGDPIVWSFDGVQVVFVKEEEDE